MITKEELRGYIVDKMVEHGDLKRLPGGEFLEDMGGHILHESNIDDTYIEDWFKTLSEEELHDIFGPV